MAIEAPRRDDPHVALHEQERRARRITSVAALRIYGITLFAFAGGGVLAGLVWSRYSWLILPAVSAGFFTSIVVNRWLIARWWRWASTQGVDYEILFHAAEQRGLMIPRSVAYPGLTPLERAIRKLDDERRERRRDGTD